MYDLIIGMLLQIDWRQKGDYGNIFDYNKDSVEPLFQSVKEMLDLIYSEIENTI